MDRSALRIGVFLFLLGGGFVLLDVALHRLIPGAHPLDLPHFVLAACVLLISFFAVHQTAETRRRSEATLRRAHEESDQRARLRAAELEQSNAAMKRATERLELTQEAAGAGSWDWDLASGHIEWSPKMYELFGMDARTTSATLEAWGSVLHPEDRAAAEGRINAALETHTDLASEYQIIRPGGQVAWISALGRGVYDEEGRPIRMRGICLDVTERRRAQARAEHLSSFPQLNPNPVLEVNASGAITFCNPACARALELLGLEDDARLFLPDDLPAVLEELEQGRDVSLQREVRVGSATFTETIQAIPAFKVARIYAFEITGRKRAEEALRASEEKYRLLFERMAEGFALYELLYDEQGQPADWRILEVNDAYTRHTGVARDRIAGRRMSELFPDAIFEYLPLFAAVVATQQHADFETRSILDGRYLHVVTFPAGGRRFASIIEDISERRRVEAELASGARQRAALEERQRLARELHDSVSQALYGISLGVHTALAVCDAGQAKLCEALNYSLSLAEAALTEMRALIFELRPESLETEGLVAALDKRAAAVRANNAIDVQLSLCDEPDVPVTLKEALYRIAQEALHNAVKHARPTRLEVHLTRAPDALVLEVRDNGQGFDSHIDYPGHLGLRSMRERAAHAGGTLEIASSPDGGTQVLTRIPLPAARPA